MTYTLRSKYKIAKWYHADADVVAFLQKYFKEKLKRNIATSNAKYHVSIDIASLLFIANTANPAASLYDRGVIPENAKHLCTGTEHLYVVGRFVAALFTIKNLKIYFVFDGARNPVKKGTDVSRDKSNKMQIVSAEIEAHLKEENDNHKNRNAARREVKAKKSANPKEHHAQSFSKAADHPFPDDKTLQAAISSGSPEQQLLYMHVIDHVAQLYNKESNVDYIKIISPFEGDCQTAHVGADLTMSVDGDLHSFGSPLAASLPHELRCTAENIHSKEFIEQYKARFDKNTAKKQEDDTADVFRLIVGEFVESSKVYEAIVLGKADPNVMYPNDDLLIQWLRKGVNNDDNLLFCFRCVHIASGCDYCPNLPLVGKKSVLEICREVLDELFSTHHSQDFDRHLFLKSFLDKLLAAADFNKFQERFGKFYCSKVESNFSKLFEEMPGVDRPVSPDEKLPDGKKQKDTMKSRYVVLFCRALSSFCFHVVIDGIRLDGQQRRRRFAPHEANTMNVMSSLFVSIFDDFECWDPVPDDKKNLVIAEIDLATGGKAHFQNNINVNDLVITATFPKSIVHPRASGYVVHFNDKIVQRFNEFIGEGGTKLYIARFKPCNPKDVYNSTTTLSLQVKEPHDNYTDEQVSKYPHIDENDLDVEAGKTALFDSGSFTSKYLKEKHDSEKRQNKSGTLDDARLMMQKDPREMSIDALEKASTYKPSPQLQKLIDDEKEELIAFCSAEAQNKRTVTTPDFN